MKQETVLITATPEWGSTWYNGHVGETFVVYDYGKDFVLKEDYDLGHNATWRHIAKSDCEVLISPPAQPRWTADNILEQHCKDDSDNRLWFSKPRILRAMEEYANQQVMIEREKWQAGANQLKKIHDGIKEAENARQ